MMQPQEHSCQDHACECSEDDACKTGEEDCKCNPAEKTPKEPKDGVTEGAEPLASIEDIAEGK